MKPRTLPGSRPLPFAILTAATVWASSPGQPARGEGAYPEARRTGLVESLHGVEVADPYRWMEEIDSDETRRWVDAQVALADAHLSSIPERAAVRARLEALWDYERVSAPVKRGGRAFFVRNAGLQNQSVLYWQPDGEGGEPQVLIDPNEWSEDGTVALSGWAPSDDGKLLAYGVSRSGSDWQEWKVREVETGRDSGDVLEWVKFSRAAWSPDSAGFCYSRYDQPADGEELSQANYFQKVYYHRVGTPQSEDVLVYERPDEKEWGFRAHFTEDGRFLLLSVWTTSAGNNALFYRDLAKGADVPFVELFRDFDARYEYVGHDGDTMYVRTDKGAPNGRLVAVDLADPVPSAWRDIIPESRATLEDAGLFGDTVVAILLEDASSVVRLAGLDGAARGTIELPGIGSVGGFGGRRSDRETFFTFESFAVPPAIYRHDFETGATALFRRPEVAVDPGAFEVRRVFVTARDGTRIPMFLAHRRGLEPAGEAPVYQYGYGGFNIPITPRFSVANLVWMEMGGVYAQVSLRGGGEYGEEWHKAGMLANKQNVFDDFIAASEWLIREGITRPDRLAIGGRSNGGLLVGACLTQRPDLYGACLPGVGVMDMLRFHQFTIGWAWQGEYGSPDKADDFTVLRAYSPYHNIQPGRAYPPTMVATADHDDRVFPAHSFKFAAALQHAQSGEAPILIRIERKAGHGAGRPVSKFIDDAADHWAFLVRHLGVALPGDWPGDGPEAR